MTIILTVIALSLSAASSYIYDKDHDTTKGISAGRALEYFNMAKVDAVVPSGAPPGWMQRICIYRTDDKSYPTGFVVNGVAFERDTEVVANSLPGNAKNIRIIN